jgi:hypothetical protein
VAAHVRDLPAAVSTGPAVIVTFDTSVVAYVRVHCKPAGPLPPLDDKLTTAVPPGVTEPAERESPPACARTEAGPQSNKEETIGNQRETINRMTSG